MNFIKTSLLLLSVLHAISARTIHQGQQLNSEGHLFQGQRVNELDLNDLPLDLNVLLSGNIEGGSPVPHQFANQIQSQLEKWKQQILVQALGDKPVFVTGYKPAANIPISHISDQPVLVYNPATGSNSVSAFNPADFLPAGSNGNDGLLQQIVLLNRNNQNGMK